MTKRLFATFACALAFVSNVAAAEYVAQVGAVKYSSLSVAAGKLTKTNNQLTVLADCTASNVPLPGGFDVTVDLGGHEVSVRTGTTLFKMSSACNKTLVISNGTVTLSCPALIAMDVFGTGNLALSRLQVRSTSTAAKHMVVSWANTTIDKCVFVSDGGVGIVRIGENVADSLPGRPLTCTCTKSTFQVKRLHSGTSSEPWHSACFFVHHGSTVNLKNCECFGKDRDSPAPYVVFEANTSGHVVFIGGYYVGPLMADYHANDNIVINGGLFLESAFLTRSNYLGYDYYHIAGGSFDTDPATNSCRYLAPGVFDVTNVPYAGLYTITDDPPPGPVPPEPVVYYTLKLDRTPVGGHAVGMTLAGATYPADTPISVTAEADEGYEFLGWYDADDQLIYDWTTYSFTLTENRAFHPVFTKKVPKKIEFTAEGFEGEYDGTRHGITVKVKNPASASARYALSEEGPFRIQQYYFTNVVEAPTPVKVWFEIKTSTAGYETVVSNATVQILPRKVRLSSASQTWEHDWKAHSNNYVRIEDPKFVKNEGVTFSGFPTITDIGEVTNTFAYAFNPGTRAENYEITTTNGLLKVIPAWPRFSARLNWKYLKATGTYFAQIVVTCTNRYDVGLDDFRYVFADRLDAGGLTNACLWKTQLRRANPNAETSGDAIWRWVTLDGSPFDATGAYEGTVRPDPVTYGVRDLAAATVPVDERTVEMYVRKRVSPTVGQEGTSLVDDFVGYLSWVSGDKTNSIPLVADPSAALPLVQSLKTRASPLAPRALNASLAVGAPVGETSSPYCRIADFSVGESTVSGRVEVGAEDGETVTPGEIGANADVRLLGAASVGGPFVEVGAVRTDGSFVFERPEGMNFFSVRVTVEEVLK